MWDLPGPGLEPTSSALAGRFLTTTSQGKPDRSVFEDGRPGTESKQNFMQNNTAGLKGGAATGFESWKKPWP